MTRLCYSDEELRAGAEEPVQFKERSRKTTRGNCTGSAAHQSVV
jgi:hypothetical protein